LTHLIDKLRKGTKMRLTGSQIDQEVMTGMEPTPPTQELPVEAPPAQPSSSRTHLRYRALVAAVRRHELLSSHPAVPKRPADHALYAALNELHALPPIARKRPPV
jgi:hypothetical protein